MSGGNCSAVADRGLVDFSLTQPSEYKLKGQKQRWFFKKVVRDFLPDEILAKKKQGFKLQFWVRATMEQWLQSHDR